MVSVCVLKPSSIKQDVHVVNDGFISLKGFKMELPVIDKLLSHLIC